MSAITALTAQNTTGVRSIQDTQNPDILADQINMVFEDIPPVAVKIGMVSATDIIDVIAERLTFHHATTSCSTRLWWPLPVPSSSVTMPLRP